MKIFKNSGGLTVDRTVKLGSRQKHRYEDSYVDKDASDNQIQREISGMRPIEEPKSLLVWHVTLWFDFIYSIFYCFIMILIHFYKGFGGLVYP